VTTFSIGHSTTLLLGVLGGVHVNPFLVDAIIGLSVVYIAFDNLGGLQVDAGFQPDTKLASYLRSGARVRACERKCRSSIHRATD
jgi:hypothetical protein